MPNSIPTEADYIFGRQVMLVRSELGMSQKQLALFWGLKICFVLQKPSSYFFVIFSILGVLYNVLLAIYGPGPYFV